MTKFLPESVLPIGPELVKSNDQILSCDCEVLGCFKNTKNSSFQMQINSAIELNNDLHSTIDECRSSLLTVKMREARETMGD